MSQDLFHHGSDEYHILRAAAGGDISADKAAELLRKLFSGKKVKLPIITLPGPTEPPPQNESEWEEHDAQHGSDSII